MMPGPGAPSDFSVHVTGVEGGWEVHIVGSDGSVASARRCGGETEARTFASTVQQHLYWLSPEKFRVYYRLGEPVA